MEVKKRTTFAPWTMLFAEEAARVETIARGRGPRAALAEVEVHGENRFPLPVHCAWMIGKKPGRDEKGRPPRHCSAL